MPYEGTGATVGMGGLGGKCGGPASCPSHFDLRDRCVLEIVWQTFTHKAVMLILKN